MTRNGRSQIEKGGMIMLVAVVLLLTASSLCGCSKNPIYDPEGFCFIGDAPTQSESTITMSSDETRDECNAWAQREGMYVIRWEEY